MKPSERVLVGVIATAHGIRGDVVIKSYTAVPEELACYGPLTDAAGGRPLTVTISRSTAKGLIGRVEGVVDRNGAEALRGAELWAAREAMPTASEDEYYYVDLEGLAAVDEAGQRFGQVVRVVNFGAGDLLDVAIEVTGKTEFVPFQTAFVPEVDIAGGRVVVKWPLQFEVVNPDSDGGDKDADGAGGE